VSRAAEPRRLSPLRPLGRLRPLRLFRLFGALLATLPLTLDIHEARAADAESAPAAEAFARLPPPSRASIQYGVAFTVEDVAEPGPVCSDAGVPCILGSGGGIAARVGVRPVEDWYIGGAYEFS
jgi:hypothetical protein